MFIEIMPGAENELREAVYFTCNSSGAQVTLLIIAINMPSLRYLDTFPIFAYILYCKLLFPKAVYSI
jgi:hypothetical protein